MQLPSGIGFGAGSGVAALLAFLLYNFILYLAFFPYYSYLIIFPQKGQYFQSAPLYLIFSSQEVLRPAFSYSQALWRINRCFANHAVLEHIFQVDQITVVHVLCKVVSIMKLKKPLFMRGHNIRRQKESLGNIFAYFSCHIVALHTVTIV